MQEQLVYLIGNAFRIYIYFKRPTEKKSVKTQSTMVKYK